MRREDIQKLFNLIETLYPSAKKNPRIPAVLEAWALVLEPWSYEDAKQAVIIRARENRFPPDASELVPYLPKPEQLSENAPEPAEPTPAQSAYAAPATTDNFTEIEDDGELPF